MRRFDEGFIVSGAMMVLDGQWPLRDFYSCYGPGQYAVIAALFGLFGQDLLVSRVADIALLGITGGLLFLTVQRLVGGRRAAGCATLGFVALVGVAHPSANYPALSCVPLFLGCALLFGTWSAQHLTGGRAARARLGWASALVGVIAALRWDFGFFAMLALYAATACVSWRQRATWQTTLRNLGAAATPALLLALAVYLPLLAVDGARWVDEVPLFLAREFATWRNLEMLRPSYRALGLAWEQRDWTVVGGAVLRLIFMAFAFAVPPLAAWAAWGKLRPSWRGSVDAATGTTLLLILCDLLLLNQMRVRPSYSQGLPAVVLALVLLPWMLTSLGTRWHVVARGAALLLLALVCIGAVMGQLRYFNQGNSKEVFQRATAVRLPANDDSRNYASLVAHLQRTTAPQKAIFSGVADTTRLLLNDAMLYFLTGRRSATRFMEMEPGLANTEKGQREMVAELERANTSTVVLLDYTVDEPNRTAVSNGVTLFDDWVRLNFAPSAHFGSYTVLTRKAAR